MMTDWGVHLLDVVHWATGVDAPLTAYATGGKYFMTDNRETPDNLEVVYEYPGFLATFSHRMTNATIDGKPYGIQFEGTDGTLFVDRAGYELRPERRRVGDETDPPKEKPTRGESTAQHLPHIQNFIE
jgi:predicted dehydrogenase